MNLYPSSPTHFAASVASNEGYLCYVALCQKSRVGLSKYCVRHTKVFKRLGHPLGKAVAPVALTWQRQKVAALFAANPDHAGLKAALQWTSQWLAGGLAGEASNRAAVELQRLDAGGVDAMDILQEAAAMALWTVQNPTAFPDQKAADFGMSRAICALAPKATRQGVMSGKQQAVEYGLQALKYIGPLLRQSLAGFFALVRSAIEQEGEQREAIRSSMRMPMNPPAEVYSELQNISAVAAPQSPALPF